MADVVIIGYGNPLRSDDGLGWRAAQQLAPMLQGLDAEVVTCHQLTPELAETIRRASLVVFIDADGDSPPGKLSVRQVLPDPRLPDFTHHLTPATLLAYAEAMYGARPKAFAFSVSAESFAVGEELSPSVASALPRLVAEVQALVEEEAVHGV
ncbi:MAG: hydrogenase maturation protease [Abditibacteriales bacterium]|nr:hydrogenase maturation protease [Abditibacteriales bacterium]MDW8368290.1 hydrogenase maturation protease [Abditibacteriales bacterium]